MQGHGRAGCDVINVQPSVLRHRVVGNDSDVDVGVGLMGAACTGSEQDCLDGLHLVEDGADHRQGMIISPCQWELLGGYAI